MISGNLPPGLAISVFRLKVPCGNFSMSSAYFASTLADESHASCVVTLSFSS